MVVDGLEPGASVPYEVALDGHRAWPEEGSDLPSPRVRTIVAGGPVDIVAGSCRVSLPQEPPFVLDGAKHEEGQGIDALRALALRLTRSSPDEWPGLLLMMGDQVYADDLSPAMLEVTRSRNGDSPGAPDDELASYGEYALAYREAWSDPLIRWLLSVVPTAMIFDDHEIHAEWKISELWLERMRAHDWFGQRIASGLSAYWVHQHIGNLSPADLAEDRCYRAVREADDAWDVLAAQMRDADQQTGHSRWSFARDLGHSKLVAIDARANRVLGRGERAMLDEPEWRWVEEQVSGDFEHVLLVSSVPFLLIRGLHDFQAAVDALAEGSRGHLAAKVAERVRLKAVLDHWASFPRSFDRLTRLLGDLTTGRLGRPPRSVLLLSGDVHHCYVAEAGLPVGTGAQSSIWQVVCSALRKDLEAHEKRAMKLGNSRTGGVIGRALARAARAQPPRLGWRVAEPPSYDNHVGTLTLSDGPARLRVETTTGADWRAPELRLEFERALD